MSKCGLCGWDVGSGLVPHVCPASSVSEAGEVAGRIPSWAKNASEAKHMTSDLNELVIAAGDAVRREDVEIAERMAEIHRNYFVSLEADGNNGMAQLQRVRQEEARGIADAIRARLGTPAIDRQDDQG